MTATAERADSVDLSQLPAHAVHVRALWPPEPNALCRLMTVLVEAAAVPELVGKLGLKEEELYVPDAGGPAAGKACVVLGEAVLVSTFPDVYRPAPRYPLG
jgi:hypothetical protein